MLSRLKKSVSVFRILFGASLILAACSSEDLETDDTEVKMRLDSDSVYVGKPIQFSVSNDDDFDNFRWYLGVAERTICRGQDRCSFTLNSAGTFEFKVEGFIESGVGGVDDREYEDSMELPVGVISDRLIGTYTNTLGQTVQLTFDGQYLEDSTVTGSLEMISDQEIRLTPTTGEAVTYTIEQTESELKLISETQTIVLR